MVRQRQECNGYFRILGLLATIRIEQFRYWYQIETETLLSLVRRIMALPRISNTRIIKFIQNPSFPLLGIGLLD